jgi:hypothetical protein
MIHLRLEKKVARLFPAGGPLRKRIQMCGHGAEFGALIGAGLLRKKAGRLRFERFAQDVRSRKSCAVGIRTRVPTRGWLSTLALRVRGA